MFVCLFFSFIFKKSQCAWQGSQAREANNAQKQRKTKKRGDKGTRTRTWREVKHNCTKDESKMMILNRSACAILLDNVSTITLRPEGETKMFRITILL